MTRWLSLLLITSLLGLLPLAPHKATPSSSSVPVEASVQAFLDGLPGPLKSHRDGEYSAAELIRGASFYYGLSPRILLALLEAAGNLLNDPAPPPQLLRQPFGVLGPDGFGAQIEWAAREVRAGLGPYERPPLIVFTDGTTLTLILGQAPEGVAVQRFLARGRSQAQWRAVVDQFGRAFQLYFNNELPTERRPQPAATSGFLQRPWPAGVNVVHLSYFDHMYPTVDTGQSDNNFVVDYLGRGNVQYDGHDGHDFYFPNEPIGTLIMAAAPGMAYARTRPGKGVIIVHANGYETVYWHLDKFSRIFEGKLDTDQGVAVEAGAVIGSSGNSGFTSGTPHLHFEVRHNGDQVDPYGWYGPGDDPCAAYAACEASVWLWSASLAGEFDFTPPQLPPPDTQPPLATLSVNPQPDVLFLARFDGAALQQIGRGTPAVAGALAYAEAKFGTGVSLSSDDRLAYPANGNLRTDAGTIALWALLPNDYPPNGVGRNYLITASAHPAEGPVYTGTLSLRRDLLGPGGEPRWNFWTTPEAGIAARDDLTVPDTLGSGLHHFAISWDRAAGAKALYIDGVLAASRAGVDLPIDIGPVIEIGRFMPGFGLGGATLDELTIFSRALTPPEVAELAAAPAPLRAGARRVGAVHLTLDTNALDSAGGIMGVQLGVDGMFGDPQPYEDSYELRLPPVNGAHTVAARFFDRAGNSAIVSATVTLAEPPRPLVIMEHLSSVSTTLIFSPTDVITGVELQISAAPDFAGTAWQPLPERLDWLWAAGVPRVLWVRFRDEELASSPAMIGPDVRRVSLPLIR